MAWPRIESFKLFVSLIHSFSGESKWRYSKIQSSNLFDLSSLFLPLIFREINRFGCLHARKHHNQFRSVGPWVPYLKSAPKGLELWTIVLLTCKIPQDDKVGDLSPHRKLTRPQATDGFSAESKYWCFSRVWRWFRAKSTTLDDYPEPSHPESMGDSG